MALKIDEVIAELRDLGFDAQKVKEAEVALRKLEEEKKEERSEEKAPKQKNQYVIVLNNADGSITKSGITGWVVQLPEGEDVATTLDRLKRAAKSQNVTVKKFIKAPLKSFGDAMQNLRRKFTKVEKVHIKTPEEVQVILADNSL